MSLVCVYCHLVSVEGAARPLVCGFSQVFLLDNFWPLELWLWESTVEVLLVSAEGWLTSDKFLIKGHLRPNENLFLIGLFLKLWQCGHAFRCSHSDLPTTTLDVGALRSVDLPQACLEPLTVFVVFELIIQASAIELDVRIPARSVRAIVNTSWLNDGRWRHPLALRCERSYSRRLNRFVKLVKAAVVSLDEGVPSCAVSKVVHVECLGFHLGSCHFVVVLSLEGVSNGNAVDLVALYHISN